jgi:hypothetical protein
LQASINGVSDEDEDDCRGDEEEEEVEDEDDDEEDDTEDEAVDSVRLAWTLLHESQASARVTSLFLIASKIDGMPKQMKIVSVKRGLSQQSLTRLLKYNCKSFDRCSS